MRTAALLLAFAFSLNAATVQGVVRDAQGHAVNGATVRLISEAMQASVTADAQGRYRFTVPAGSYRLHAEYLGGEANAGPVDVSGAETRAVDLKLEYAFYDRPAFIAAGVTDTMNRGGHGSDIVLRSAESLAKATAALSDGSSPAAAREMQGDSLEAVREYQRAAEAEPGEANLFNWGAELLKHRAAEQAVDVFQRGCRLFPKSLRMLLGLAAAEYARGAFDAAARSFFAACDLAPGNPEPYLFLGKAQSPEMLRMPGYRDRMQRFVQHHPENAWANYYYALSLWKQRESPEDTATPKQVTALLETAVRIDPNLGAAYLLAGIVSAGQGDNQGAIAAYQRAIDSSPEMEEPHYRLAQAYGSAGEKDKARRELDIYERMSRQSAEQFERERAQIRQFLFELKSK